MGRTEELLGAAALLNHLDDTGLQLLDRGNVLGKNTHLAGLSGEVDLDDIGGLVDGLVAAITCQPTRSHSSRRARPPSSQLIRARLGAIKKSACFIPGGGATS
jgi:hypothetical protein